VGCNCFAAGWAEVDWPKDVVGSGFAAAIATHEDLTGGLKASRFEIAITLGVRPGFFFFIVSNPERHYPDVGSILDCVVNELGSDVRVGDAAEEQGLREIDDPFFDGT